MRPLDIRRQIQTTKVVDGVVVSDYSADYDTVQFSFSGFGKGDYKNKSLPTAGSYQKLDSTIPYGRVRNYTILKSTGQIQPNDTVTTGVYTVDVLPLRIYRSSFDTSVYNEAVTRCYDRIRASSLNLAVSVGEIKETQRMLNNAAKAMNDIISFARRSRREFLRSPTKTLAQIHLSYKYGWLPLYNDLYGIVKHHRSQWKEVTAVGTAHRHESLDYVDTTGPSFYRPSGSYYRRYRGPRHWQAKVSVNVAAGDSTAFELSRLTSLNPLGIAWELVPFSFVVDWVWDIGGYLASMENSFGTGVVFKHGFVTELYYHNLSGTLSGTGYGDDSPYQYVEERDLKASELFVVKRREVLNDFPRPRFPPIKLNLGSSRILSGAALLRTVLLGKH